MDLLSWNLLLAAAGIAIVHTALGPDHYLPFVMIGRARKWTMARTLVITALCGIGHVGSSLLLGGLGILAGMAIAGVEGLEQLRGSAAGWALVAVGCAYGLWGLRQASRHRHGLEVHRHGAHVHLHEGGDGQHAHQLHAHAHDHGPAHHHGPHQEVAPAATAEAPAPSGKSVTFWALFLVFVLGPCEPLIPLFVVPASEGRWSLAITVGVVFAVTTIGTMLAITGAMYAGVSKLPLGALERWSHALAGGVIASSGLGMLFLGL